MPADPYLAVWDIDFTTRANRIAHGHRRDIAKERAIEVEVTRLLRTTFSFRCIAMDDQDERMGTGGIESALIGTIAGCTSCQPSATWLGQHSPVEGIRQSGLWLVQHLTASPLNPQQRVLLSAAIAGTLNNVPRSNSQ